VSEEQIKELAKSGTAKRTLTFRSPVGGFVSEKKAVQGMRFMPGDALYQISDLSSVWVIADVFEQDIASVRTGARAQVKINAYPDKVFNAALTYVYPTLNAETRTVPVRLELVNPGGLFKPGMFSQVELPVGGKGQVVTVPVSALLDSGARQIVLVQVGKLEDGRFEPRTVRIGARSDNYLEVLEGVREGEQVVVSANFLIDAESNLKAAIAGFGASAPVAK
jgi:RND family efflux transporter MFP subunit